MPCVQCFDHKLYVLTDGALHVVDPSLTVGGVSELTKDLFDDDVVAACPDQGCLEAATL